MNVVAVPGLHQPAQKVNPFLNAKQFYFLRLVYNIDCYGMGFHRLVHNLGYFKLKEIAIRQVIKESLSKITRDHHLPSCRVHDSSCYCCSSG